MKIFKKIGDNLSYKDRLQLDGAYSVCHINYGKAPLFNKNDGKNITKNSRKNSLSKKEKIDDVIENIYSFNGTEKGLKKNDRIELWKNYFIEYVNAFDNLIDSLPKSVVTIYVGRQAIEIGFKYLLLKKTENIVTGHDLKKLSDCLYSEYDINDNYMDNLDKFCEFFSKYIEGENVEYFRFPEYKENNFFAGNRLDIEWLSFNLALVILKLIHFAELDDEFKK